MFMRVVTELTSISTRAGGEKTDTNPSRLASRRNGCWKGWERLGKAEMFSRRLARRDGVVGDTYGRLR